MCFLDGSQTPDKWSADKCTLTTGHSSSLLLWGDSFAAHYAPGLLANQAAIPFNIIQRTAAGCPPVLDYFSYSLPHCQDFNKQAIELIGRIRPEIVVLSARWDLLLSRSFRGLQETVDRISSTGAKVIVVGPSPRFGMDVQSLAYWLRNDGQASSIWRISNFDPAVNEILERNSKGATVLDPIGALCGEDGACPYKRTAVSFMSTMAISLHWAAT